MEEIMTNQPTEVSAEKAAKTWSYSEKTNRHVTHHTICITKNRFTHQAKIEEASQAMKQRTDISLKNVHSVNTYYGLSRNVVGTIILAVLALVALVIGFAQIARNIAVFCVMLVVAALFGVLAFFTYKKVKPTFVLEINTVVKGTVTQNALAYGNANISFGKKHHSPLFYLVLIVLWPIGIIYLLSRRKGNTYTFEMSPEVGNEIVETIGEYCLED